MDIGGWLRSLGLERYEEAFRENEIDETVLPSLTAEDLKNLGVGIVGHRRKLLDAIAVLAQISHTTECIGVANQRKPLCRNNSSSIRGAPRCRQSVARISLDLNLLKAARW